MKGPEGCLAVVNEVGKVAEWKCLGKQYIQNKGMYKIVVFTLFEYI